MTFKKGDFWAKRGLLGKKGTFGQKGDFWAKRGLLGKKGTFGQKEDFWAIRGLFGQKMIYELDLSLRSFFK
jgi:hypothetical protein